MADPRGVTSGSADHAQTPETPAPVVPGATNAPSAGQDTGEGVSTREKRHLLRILTCSGCPARWTGETRAHCSACHRTFTSVSGFDAHRSQDGEHGSCKHPSAAGLVERRDGMWSSPAPDPTRREITWRTA